MAGPEDVGLAELHALDVGEETLVSLEGGAGLELGVGGFGVEAVDAAVGGGGETRAKVGEGAFLGGDGILAIAQLARGAGGEKTDAYVEQTSRR